MRNGPIRARLFASQHLCQHICSFSGLRSTQMVSHARCQSRFNIQFVGVADHPALFRRCIGFRQGLPKDLRGWFLRAQTIAQNGMIQSSAISGQFSQEARNTGDARCWKATPI